MSESIVFPYIFERKLGGGGYGKVYEVKHKVSKQKFACKIIKGSKFDEASFMLKLKNHDNIIKLHEYYCFDKQSAIIMEKCSGFNILNELNAIQNIYERNYYREQYILQCMQAIKHCHDNYIVHRDIKHSNFMIHKETDRSIVKLIDFGMSQYDFGYTPCTVCGTLQFMPPEGFCAPYNNLTMNAHTLKYDIWSLGIMMYMLYTGVDMFYANNEKTIVKYIRTRKINNSMKSIKNMRLNRLIYKMLNISPTMRPTIEEVYHMYRYSINR